MKRCYGILLSLILALPTFGQRSFSKQEVMEDLVYLRESLENAHYDLYAYTTKEAFDQQVENVQASLTKDSLTLLETTSLFQSVITKANNGHTEIPFPVAAYADYAGSNGTLFPLELAFEQGKALIRKNWSGNDALEIGAEVIRINNRTMSELLERIYPLISAERRYFKLAKLELFSFPRFYWQAFGEQTSFEVEVKQDGQLETYQLAAIDLIEGFEERRHEIWSDKREWRVLDHAAYLKPGNFGGDEQAYRRFIDSAFVEINNKNLPNLIIDLRNNRGGGESFSNYLVSYIADQPFRWCSDFRLKTSAILKAHVRETYDTTDRYWQSVLTHADGSVYPYEFEEHDPQAQENRYAGTVYVLVNRQSHSQAAVTAAQVQDYNFATIVGEETGDFPSLYASQYSYHLPRTGIEVKLAKGHIVRINGSKKPEGVLPDIYIQDHLLDEEDEILDGLLEIIDHKH